MIEEEPRESQKDISTNFLSIILDSIMKLQEYETHMKRGCSDLIEYIQTLTRDRSVLNYVRVENMGFMILEFELLFPNIKDIVKKSKMEIMEKNLKGIKKAFENGIVLKESDKRIFAYHEPLNQRTKTRSITIDPLFSVLAENLSELRSKTISSLIHILHAQKGEKQSGKQIY